MAQANVPDDGNQPADSFLLAFGHEKGRLDGSSRPGANPSHGTGMGEAQYLMTSLPLTISTDLMRTAGEMVR